MNVIKSFITNSAFDWAKKEKQDKNSLAGFVISHIETENKLRDTQIESIKVYLWLKCFVQNKPIIEIFEKYYSLEEGSSLKVLLENLASEIDSEKLSKFSRTATDIEIKSFFEVFFGDYNGIANYLFSLPMGAGKTFVMATIIYIDLYFNLTQNNPAFAKNFLIFAPSGLKSSVIPSLRTIERFDPTWVLPSDIALQIKKQLKFIVLDENKSQKKSNRTENPNANKVKQVLEQTDPFGNVFVTNAEKVILDRIVEDPNQHTLFEMKEDEKSKQANELRHMLGKVPNLSILIDEVHHAQKDENKLKLVIKSHFSQDRVNSIIGFTGTPYEKRKVTVQNVTLNLDQITNTVYHYELRNGIKNFLKQPLIKSFSSDTQTIVNSALKDFYDRYYKVSYKNGRKPKLAIYCSNIERLEEEVLPLVTEFYRQNGLDYNEIFKYYGSNKVAKSGKKYALAKDADAEFSKLDSSDSKKRIILLCQIGKEGWDCQSLSGVVLSGEGDSPKNMVLQASCRCLREVDDPKHEVGLIYLNQSNYQHLEKELQESHKITIKEFEEGSKDKNVLLRVDRRKHLELPPLSFNQFVVEYDTCSSPESIAPTATLSLLLEKISSKDKSYFAPQLKKTKTSFDFIDKSDLQTEIISRYTNRLSFSNFVVQIAKSSFNFIEIKDLNTSKELLDIYDVITKNGLLNDNYLLSEIISGIHEAFLPQSIVKSFEKINLESVGWLISDINKNPLSDTAKIYPNDLKTINEFEKYDQSGTSPLALIDSYDERIKNLEKSYESEKGDKGAEEFISSQIEKAKNAKLPILNKDKSFHYIPYDFSGSDFEKQTLEHIFTMELFKNNGLEVYFNGDRFISTFKIKIYKKTAHGWVLAQGKYTPDFLIIQRKNKAIEKALIIETKGSHLSHNFTEIREFMESQFLKDNKERFDFLYLEDSDDEKNKLQKMSDKIIGYFK